ncbi:MAG: hypothetical protein NTW19_08505 [Planctomycetota bacterium]|nr:hypothetical protein [Planctomycetota bacterium]
MNFSILANRESGDFELMFPRFLEHGYLPDNQPASACREWKHFTQPEGG